MASSLAAISSGVAPAVTTVFSNKRFARNTLPSLSQQPAFGSSFVGKTAQFRVHRGIRINGNRRIEAKFGGFLGGKKDEVVETGKKGTKKIAQPKKGGTLKQLFKKSGTTKERGGTEKQAVAVKKDLSKDKPAANANKLGGTLKLLFGTKPVSQLARDDNVVFVAGATGKVGSRTVRELLKLGFKVRAGARDVGKAQDLFEEIEVAIPKEKANFWASIFGGGSKKSKLEIVQYNLEDADSLEDAIREAGKIVCAVGASEKEALNFQAPYNIDGKATKNLVKAAARLGVSQFVLVTSLGTGKVGFPAALLNLFWGVLVWKSQAEKALKDSGIAFTIVRPGGMERPTDTFKETNNLRLAPADTLFGGQVSNLQVAELIAAALANPELSENKVIEVVAETTAPLRPIEELLAELPLVGLSKLQREEAAAAKEQADAAKLAAKEAEEAKRLQEEEAAEQKRLEAQQKEEERRLAEEQAALEKQQAEEARKVAEEKAKVLRARLSAELVVAKEKQRELTEEAEASNAERAALEKLRQEVQAKADAAAKAAAEAKALEAAVKAAARQGKILSASEKEQILAAVRSQASSSQAPASKASLLGGLAPWDRISGAVKEVAAPALPKEEEAPATGLEEARAAAAAKVKANKEALAKKEAEEKEKAAAKAEAEAKAAAAKVKAQQEAEAKKLEEEETKAKADEEAKAAAAKVKAQQEAEAKKLEEEKAKAKAAEEAKLKVQVEEEAKMKQEAEEKRKQEEAEAAAAEAKLEAEAKAAAKEAEALKEEEAKAKAEALKEAERERKRKLQEEAIATAKAAEAVKKEPRVEAQGFRWPWQKQEASEVDQAPAETRPVSSSDLPPSPTPLSPYSRYPDLKPPTSPTPSASREVAAAEVPAPPAPPAAPVVAAPVASAPSKTADPSLRVWVPTLEGAANANASDASKPSGFRWPWQKEGDPPESVAATPVAPDLPYANRPLSPYTMFPDLRPPSSPSPLPYQGEHTN